MTIDFYDDLGAAFASAHNQPSFAKEASWREPFELLDRDFALIIVDAEGKEHRKFACFDEGNALMSAWYLQNVADLPPHAIKVAKMNLAKIAGLPLVDAALTPDEARMVIDERRVRITGPWEPAIQEKVASHTSVYDRIASARQNWSDLDPYDRHHTAVELFKEASAVGAVLPSSMLKYAGTTLNPHFESLMRERQSFTADAELQTAFDRLGKVASAMDLEDVTDILYTLDQEASLTPRYGSRLPDPYLCVYGGVEKEAEWSWNHGGNFVNAGQLVRFSTSTKLHKTMGDLFAEEIVERFRKNPVETFKSLPIEQQIILARLSTQGFFHNDGGFLR